jgi:catechol 2,3-dioxygenase
VLRVKDLSISRNFYVDLIGFIVSDEDKETIFLRGVAEACHHSLVLKRARGEPQAERVGMRVFTEEDLDKAKAFFGRAGLPAQWVEVPHQGRTLHVSDASGAPIELCATMDLKPRLVVAFEHHHGAVPQRLDHFQLLVPDVQKACEFWMSMGFRLSEYISPDGTQELLFVFLQRKGNPHDIVFAPGAGPRLHHAAFGIPESYHFFYVCDLASDMGFAANIEFGPGRHGPGHALFVYLRDPDGHRIELFNTHYQVMDIENEPVRWDASFAMKRRWQLPARRQWFVEASRFAGVEPREPDRKGDPLSLEKFIAAGMR